MNKSCLCMMAVWLSFCAMADGPTDNLRSDYRNPVLTNFVAATHNEDAELPFDHRFAHFGRGIQ